MSRELFGTLLMLPLIWQLNAAETPGNEQKVNCGQADPNIFKNGGSTIEKGQIPWLAALYNLEANQYLCSGTLISARTVIAPAHCMKKPGNHEVNVAYFGRYNLTDNNEKDVQKRFIEETIVHQDFEQRKINGNDIAILFLKSPVNFNKNINPVCLWYSDVKPIDGAVGYVAGWGRNKEALKNIPAILDVKLISPESCSQSNEQYKKFVTSQMFCAVNEIDTQLCPSLSGNALVLNHNGSWTMRGFLVAGLNRSIKNECSPDSPNVYIDIAKHMNWINRITLDLF